MSRRKAKEWFKSTFRTLTVAALISGGPLQASCLSCFDGCNLPKIDAYADFLYWEFCPEGIEYVRAGYLGGFTFAPLALQQGLVYTPSSKFFSGFRVGALAHFDCCDWDAFAQYTWHHPILSDHIAIPLLIGSVPASTLQPTVASRTPAAPFETISSASEKWSTTFNVVDFGVGRSFNVSDCFTFRPHFGAKATKQEIKTDITYIRTISSQSTTNRIHNEVDLWGIGPRAGFDATWHFSSCFSIVGNLALSAMYADFDAKRDDYFAVVSTTSTSFDLGHQRQEICAVLPVLELFLGVRYEMCNFFAMLGWEEQVWFNYNRNILETADFQGPHGNLVIQGVTLKGGVQF